MLIYDNVSVRYGRKTVLENISFSIPENSVTAVIGQNGSGKSTLISCAVGTVKYSGKITYNGEDVNNMSVRERAKTISFLPQMINAVPITVTDLVKMGRNPYLDLTKRLSDKDIECVEYAIRVTGLEDIRDCYINQLSGGECRKAYIAMILAQNTDLIILDEPTAYMDMGFSCYFSQLLLQLKNQYNKTFVVVSHDITSVCDYADNIILLNDKNIVFNNSVSNFNSSNIAESVFGVKRINYTYNGETKVIYR